MAAINQIVQNIRQQTGYWISQILHKVSALQLHYQAEICKYSIPRLESFIKQQWEPLDEKTQENVRQQFVKYSEPVCDIEFANKIKHTAEYETDLKLWTQFMDQIFGKHEQKYINVEDVTTGILHQTHHQRFKWIENPITVWAHSLCLEHKISGNDLNLLFDCFQYLIQNYTGNQIKQIFEDTPKNYGQLLAMVSKSVPEYVLIETNIAENTVDNPKKAKKTPDTQEKYMKKEFRATIADILTNQSQKHSIPCWRYQYELKNCQKQSRDAFMSKLAPNIASCNYNRSVVVAASFWRNVHQLIIDLNSKHFGILNYFHPGLIVEKINKINDLDVEYMLIWRCIHHFFSVSNKNNDKYIFNMESNDLNTQERQILNLKNKRFNNINPNPVIVGIPLEKINDSLFNFKNINNNEIPLIQWDISSISINYHLELWNTTLGKTNHEHLQPIYNPVILPDSIDNSWVKNGSVISNSNEHIFDVWPDIMRLHNPFWWVSTNNAVHPKCSQIAYKAINIFVDAIQTTHLSSNLPSVNAIKGRILNDDPSDIVTLGLTWKGRGINETFAPISRWLLNYLLHGVECQIYDLKDCQLKDAVFFGSVTLVTTDWAARPDLTHTAGSKGKHKSSKFISLEYKQTPWQIIRANQYKTNLWLSYFKKFLNTNLNMKKLHKNTITYMQTNAGLSTRFYDTDFPAIINSFNEESTVDLFHSLLGNCGQALFLFAIDYITKQFKTVKDDLISVHLADQVNMMKVSYSNTVTLSSLIAGKKAHKFAHLYYAGYYLLAVLRNFMTNEFIPFIFNGEAFNDFYEYLKIYMMIVSLSLSHFYDSEIQHFMIQEWHELMQICQNNKCKIPEVANVIDDSITTMPIITDQSSALWCDESLTKNIKVENNGVETLVRVLTKKKTNITNKSKLECIQEVLPRVRQSNTNTNETLTTTTTTTTTTTSSNKRIIKPTLAEVIKIPSFRYTLEGLLLDSYEQGPKMLYAHSFETSLQDDKHKIKYTSWRHAKSKLVTTHKAIMRKEQFDQIMIQYLSEIENPIILTLMNQKITNIVRSPKILQHFNQNLLRLNDNDNWIKLKSMFEYYTHYNKCAEIVLKTAKKPMSLANPMTINIDKLNCKFSKVREIHMIILVLVRNLFKSAQLKSFWLKKIMTCMTNVFVEFAVENRHLKKYDHEWRDAEMLKTSMIRRYGIIRVRACPSVKMIRGSAQDALLGYNDFVYALVRPYPDQSQTEHVVGRVKAIIQIENLQNIIPNSEYVAWNILILIKRYGPINPKQFKSVTFNMREALLGEYIEFVHLINEYHVIYVQDCIEKLHPLRCCKTLNMRQSWALHGDWHGPWAPWKIKKMRYYYAILGNPNGWQEEKDAGCAAVALCDRHCPPGCINPEHISDHGKPDTFVMRHTCGYHVDGKIILNGSLQGYSSLFSQQGTPYNFDAMMRVIEKKINNIT